MRDHISLRTPTLAILLALPVCAQAQSPFDFLNRRQPLLDAHNCYTEDGKWSNRIDRALSTGMRVGIEQDLTWYVDPITKAGRIVVSHRPQPNGSEPTLEDHFFRKVQPRIEQALRDNHRDRWPLIVLHFDFKSNDPALHRAVWNLLGKYEAWITTAPKTADPQQLPPFDPKPLLVLTEENDAQEEVFYRQLPAGAKLRIFGSVHTQPVSGNSNAEKAIALAAMAPEQLVTDRPTTYRRWWNSSWYAVEQGGQRKAGDWTPADQARLKALVGHAHKLGLWIRFYTLDGFTESQGWTGSYNFGSRDAVLKRWNAALDAGVDMIATDQYEDLAAVIKARR